MFQPDQSREGDRQPSRSDDSNEGTRYQGIVRVQTNRKPDTDRIPGLEELP